MKLTILCQVANYCGYFHLVGYVYLGFSLLM